MIFHYAPIMQVDSVNKPGILLELVQILTDLDFIITKAYISSDGGWFMDGMCVNCHVLDCYHWYHGMRVKAKSRWTKATFLSFCNCLQWFWPHRGFHSLSKHALNLVTAENCGCYEVALHTCHVCLEIVMCPREDWVL